MTPLQAKTFEQFSAKNAEILNSVCETCEPYQDWFTYKRWAAQNAQVIRGEHGTKIGVIANEKKIKIDGETEQLKHFCRATVFCRHQVKA